MKQIESGGSSGRKRRTMVCLAAILMVLLAMSCSGCRSEPNEAVNVLMGKDRVPPRLLGLKAIAPSQVRASFDEPVTLVSGSHQPLDSRKSNHVVIALEQALEPGKSVRISGTVKDEAGNRMSFEGEAYGFNPRMPEVLITELTSDGTPKSPDRTEIAALSDGNIAGMCLCDGIRTDFVSWFVFPDCEVRKGDYIIVCWDGKWSSPKPSVHVFSAKGNPSQYNGIQTLYADPSADSDALDCVIYANHEGTAYSRFGSQAMQNRAEAALDAGIWRLAAGDGELTGLDAVNSRAATATRSISRRMPYLDSDSAADWYVTVTGGSTMGADNTSEAF